MNASCASATLAALADEVWRALIARDPYTALTSGGTVNYFPRGDLAEAESVATAAAKRVAKLEAIDVSGLTRTERLTAAHLRYWLEDEMREPDRWWTTFGVAPYSISGYATLAAMVFQATDLSNADGRAHHFALAKGYVGAIDALCERVQAQAERGWRLPRAALPGARAAISGIAGAAKAAILPAADSIDCPFLADVAVLVEQDLAPAFARLAEAIGDDYERLAPDTVGIGHQPGGREAYRRWIRYHLGYEADPEEIHRIGLAEVAALRDAMAQLRVEAFGHNGDEASFHHKLREDPRAKAASPEALEQIYRHHLERMAPVFAKLVRKPPKARPAVKRLDPALEAGMTFGYYDAPQTPGADGIYHYSGNGIPDRLQLNAAPLIFHELVPGHHVHITRQGENEALPDLRRRTFAFSAFNEGWAEYSAGLAEEAGLYDDPYDLYGWLSHQRFVAQRLVVDTGLNELGWSLEQARRYMLENTLESETQVASETLRYATDMPGQALAYRLGFLKFRELRDRAKERLGPAFDLADFHEAILEQGALPIELLEQSIAEWVESRSPAPAQ